MPIFIRGCITRSLIGILILAVFCGESLAADDEYLLVRKYCIDCHGDDGAEAGVRLTGEHSQIGLLKQRKLWLRAASQISAGEMPPVDADQPAPDERRRLITWLDRSLNQVDWNHYSNPGRQSLSRLTAIEYRNSVRDIFGVELRAGVFLGRDAEGATGFTNDRDNLSFPLFAMQDYLREAERAVDTFLGYGHEKWQASFELVDLWKQSSDKSTILTQAGKAVLANDAKKPFHLGVTVPHSGKYRISLDCALLASGPASGIEVLVNGQATGRFPVDHADFETHHVTAILPRGFSTLSLVWSPDLKPDYGEVPTPPHLEERVRKSAPLPEFPIPDRLKDDDDAVKSFRRFNKTLANYECDRRLVRLLIERGETDYNRNSFLNFRQNSAPFNLSGGKIAVLMNLPQKKLEAQLKQELGFDRNDQKRAARDYKSALARKHPELVKPTPGKVRMTSLEIVSHALEPGDSDPAWAFSVDENETGAAAVIQRVCIEAFGKSPTDRQMDDLLAIYQTTSQETGSHNEGLRDALTAVLLSPDFLLRYSDGSNSETSEVDDHVIGSRLAAFLWLSIPDQTLRKMAAARTLREPEILDEAITHLIDDDRFDAFCQTFMEQWLDLDAMKGLNPTLVAAMRAEPAMLLRQVVRENHSVLDLLDAQHTWLNEPLAEHYGIPGVAGLKMRPVSLPDSRRGGLLAMGGMLTVTSTEQRTSPVARGAWIVETLLGVELPPPPPSVP